MLRNVKSLINSSIYSLKWALYNICGGIALWAFYYIDPALLYNQIKADHSVHITCLDVMHICSIFYTYLYFLAWLVGLFLQFCGAQIWWRTVTAAESGTSGTFWERCSPISLSSLLFVFVSKYRKVLQNPDLIFFSFRECSCTNLLVLSTSELTDKLGCNRIYAKVLSSCDCWNKIDDQWILSIKGLTL